MPTSRSTGAMRSSPASSRRGLAKIDFVDRKVVGYLTLSQGGMPQDIRISPDGKRFYVADMMAEGVFVVDGDDIPGDRLHSRPARERTGSIRAAMAASSMYRTADRTGSTDRHMARAAFRSSILRPARSMSRGRYPGAAAPTWAMSAPTARQLWLSGRFDNVVYVFDTASGAVRKIPGRQGTARPGGMAAAGSLFARTHGQHALTFESYAGSESSQSPPTPRNDRELLNRRIAPRRSCAAFAVSCGGV